MDTDTLMSAARELLERGHAPGVVAVCTDALENDPDNLEMRLLMARALMALDQDQQAKEQLGECLRIEPACASAYRLLGELALQRDELASAEIFLREALRLEPTDASTQYWLEQVTSRPRPRSPSSDRSATAALPREPGTLRLRGIGGYLVEVGILTISQLRQAVALHRSTGMRLGTAALALGFIAEPALERAAGDYHSRCKPVP